jgi:predicted metalloprotease with PDZ domain
MYRIKYCLIIVFLINVVFSSKATTIDYSIKMTKPQSHYFEVMMTIDDLSGKNVTIKMPVWSPGSYMIREFSKNVNIVRAFDESANKLPITKTTKNTWVIKRNGAKQIRVKYEVYSFELSVRSTFLDATHGFINGSSLFMFVDGETKSSGKLDIYPHEDFSTITTSLKKPADSIRYEGAKTFQYNNYDELIDSPIEIGNQEVFEFNAAGCEHTVALYGVGNYEISKLQVDMKKIVETTTKIIGVNPNKKYTFIIHNVNDGQGGLEHANSTTLSVSRWGYVGKDYLDFLSLVAHEYFHLWNVKRLRPIELGPFNYDQENYTSLLWVMEGFTSYYDELILRRAGYLSEQEYLQKFNSTLNYLESTEGRKVQPVAHSSFDAWIKAYRPNENSSNTTISYYTNGHILGALIDAKIIAKYNGERCLDDFMRLLYRKFYLKENRGFTEKEFEESLSSFLKEDMSIFLNDHVYDTKIPDYKTIFGNIGIKIDQITTKKISFGTSFDKSNENPKVRSIKVNSKAEIAGLSVNDEIIAINGFRVNSEIVDETINSFKENDKLAFIISRDGIIIEINAESGMIDHTTYKLSTDFASEKTNLISYWLRTDN